MNQQAYCINSTLTRFDVESPLANLIKKCRVYLYTGDSIVIANGTTLKLFCFETLQ